MRAPIALVCLLVGCEDKATSSVATVPPAPVASAVATGSAVAPAVAASATASAAAAPGTGATNEAAPLSVTAQHVLVAYKGADGAPKTVTRSKAEAKKRADEVATKAKSGADFSSLAAEYSDDPGSKERMGSVGKFTREKMVKPFADAAFGLAVGSVSDPVETKYGFHVIKRNQ